LIAGMEFDEFQRNVAPGKTNLAQQKLRQAIWRLASESIGCHVGDEVSFEAKVMVMKLHQVRETIKERRKRIENLCIQFPEYPCLASIPGFGPDVSSKVLGAIGNPFVLPSKSLSLLG